MKRLLILLVCFFSFFACTHEKEAQELYKKAEILKQEKNYAEAIKIYKEITQKFPRSSIAPSATNAMSVCEEEYTKYKIEHNKPIVLKAADEFPARKFPATQKGTLPLGKSIAAIEWTACDAAKNYAQKQPYYSEERLTASILAEMLCDYTIGKWNVSSQDNVVYIASKTRTGQGLKGEKVKKHYTYVVDISNNTIAAKDHASCFVMNEVASKLFEKETNKIAVDYIKECAFPIKLEGILK